MPCTAYPTPQRRRVAPSLERARRPGSAPMKQTSPRGFYCASSPVARAKSAAVIWKSICLLVTANCARDRASSAFRTSTRRASPLAYLSCWTFRFASACFTVPCVSPRSRRARPRDSAEDRTSSGQPSAHARRSAPRGWTTWPPPGSQGHLRRGALGRSWAPQPRKAAAKGRR